MKKIYLVLLSTICICAYGSEDPNWSVASIPAELKVKANAVVRFEDVTLTVTPNGKSELKARIVTTILNENGEQFGYFVKSYNKYVSIFGLEGVVYDQFGKKIKRIRSDDFNDFSAIAGFSIYDDNRVKASNPQVGSYPYTVEYEYTMKFKEFMVLPGWSIYPYYNVAVQKSLFTLIIEPGVNVFYQGNDKLTIKPTITETAGVKTVNWVAENFQALDKEPYTVDFSKVAPQLSVAPEYFKMDGFEGANKSWVDIGMWSTKLSQGRDSLSQATKDQIRAIAANGKNDFEKAKLLYEHMQQKVRYVSIQAGIGGWQTFPAETVERLSYGDCKALSNYMQTILKVAGIKSYYCLVRAGDDAPNINKNFVCSQFNHAFLMLPFGKDTMYLECTSQTNPFGYNGSFTDDRDVLVVDGANSFIKHTNVYGKDQNKEVKIINIKIDNDRNCQVSQTTNYYGVATEYYRFLMDEKPEKQRDIFS